MAKVAFFTKDNKRAIELYEELLMVKTAASGQLKQHQCSNSFLFGSYLDYADALVYSGAATDGYKSVYSSHGSGDDDDSEDDRWDILATALDVYYYAFKRQQEEAAEAAVAAAAVCRRRGHPGLTSATDKCGDAVTAAAAATEDRLRNAANALVDIVRRAKNFKCNKTRLKQLARDIRGGGGGGGGVIEMPGLVVANGGSGLCSASGRVDGNILINRTNTKKNNNHIDDLLAPPRRHAAKISTCSEESASACMVVARKPAVVVPRQRINNNDNTNFDCDTDPFLCAICEDLLKGPVTVPCGHTYCRECVLSVRACVQCARPVPHLQPLDKDVFIGRLVDRWWGAELNADPINAEARRFLQAGHLDEALRCANESLEQGENDWTADAGAGVTHYYW